MNTFYNFKSFGNLIHSTNPDLKFIFFQLSTSNTIITIPEVGKLSNFKLVNLLMILVKPGLCPTIIALLYLLCILRTQSKIKSDEEWYKFSDNIFDQTLIKSKK